MNKTIHLFISLGIAFCIGWLGWNTWNTTRYFQEHGREARLKIGRIYNASRWTEPLPLKKIHTYTAVLEPAYEVLVESDQNFGETNEVFIRFLTRDRSVEIAAKSFRPLVNTIRIRTPDDGSPVKLDDTDAFDKLVDKAMGPVGPDVYVRARPQAESAPDHQKPTVPYLVGGANDSTLELIWNNSRVGEWVLFGALIFLFQTWFVYAWSLPWRAVRSVAERKDFVHPSMRRIDADAPAAASKKLTYTPKPEVDIVLPSTAPRPAPIPFTPPEAPKPKGGPEDEASAPLTSHETAPPMPLPTQTEPTLRLRRK